jgi:dTDP-4-amino-4,6-dideoxygalactose transaminase
LATLPAFFRFYPTKNLGALGDGGMVVTRDPALATASREIREYGWRERYISNRVAINSRLDPIQAAILGVKLYSLLVDNARRQAIADSYDASGLGLTERAVPQILSLPMYPQFSDEAVERMIVETLRFLDSIGSLPLT